MIFIFAHVCIDVYIAFAQGQAVISSSESVPFRLTPNMQHFITRTGIEGVVTAATTAISKSLIMPEFDLAGTLSLFIRDEVRPSELTFGLFMLIATPQLLTWHNTYMKETHPDSPLTTQVYKNVDNFIRRAGMMGYMGENRDKVRFSHAIFQLKLILRTSLVMPHRSFMRLSLSSLRPLRPIYWRKWARISWLGTSFAVLCTVFRLSNDLSIRHLNVFLGKNASIVNVHL